jgi:protein-S-isoprenylcysteine O-methyltransferase Ste14
MDARAASPDACPPSAVSHGVGIAGLVGLGAWILVARHYGMNGPNAGYAAVVACGLPMLLWSLLVDKVHRDPATGIDWSSPRPLRETWRTSAVKLVGLWATWGAIALLYTTLRWYGEGGYRATMALLAQAAPLLVLASVPYMLWIDRHLVEPRDGSHAAGQWVIGARAGEPDPALLADHARAWAIKGFFLAFMLTIVPGNFTGMANWRTEDILAGPVPLASFLIQLMFVVDVAFATVGYIATTRLLGAQIRSANPYLAAWVAALICYPPFLLMGPGGPLHYEVGTAGWAHWLAASPALLWLWGALLVGLTGVYAWATVAFGPRFSNLTDRGILTHGPYRLSKHPAYLAKNAFWWLSALPFLTVSGSVAEGARNALLLAAVSGVYYWRARTEERHLSADPVYRAYAEWMERHGPVPRLARWLRGERAAVTAAAE